MSGLDRTKLFAEGTWFENQLRPAGYDLVIAKDELRVQDPAGSERMVEYGRGRAFPDSALHLNPGDFAYVTTKEELCLPWTVAGNIGVRNRFARKGLLVLTGLLVDPGYGLELVDESWEKRPKRLHFGIANVGHEPVNIVFEQDAIATVQFVVVSGRVLMNEISPPRADEGERGFRLFRDFEKKLSEVDREIVETKAATQNIVLFGLFVLMATLAGAVTAIVLGAVDNTSLSERLSTVLEEVTEHPGAALIVAIGLAAFAVIVAGVVMWPVARLLVGRRKSG